MVHSTKTTHRTILIIVLIFVIAALGTAAYGFIHRGQHKSTTQMATSSPDDQQILQLVTNMLQKDAPFLQKSSTLDTLPSTGYVVPGYSFGIILPTNHSQTFLDTKTTNEDMAYADLSDLISPIGNLLEHAGYTTVIEPSDNSLLSSTSFYSSTKNTCELTVYTALTITCTSRSTIYTAAQIATPLINLYASQTDTKDAKDITIPTITKSKSNGYTLGSVDIFDDSGQTNAHFYKADDGDWHLVNTDWYNDPHENGDIIPNCADFESNNTVRLAFSGYACYDSSTRTEATIH